MPRERPSKAAAFWANTCESFGSVGVRGQQSAANWKLGKGETGMQQCQGPLSVSVGPRVAGVSGVCKRADLLLPIWLNASSSSLNEQEH